MVKQRLSRFIFYRWRYILSYVVFGVALAVLLLVAGFYLPGGLSEGEVKSALTSDGLNPTQLFSLQPDELVYLPYRLLQAASIALFGFSAISIKLPSIILGFLSAVAILYLLNLWYRRNVAIITAMIAVTTSQFLLAAQAGQAGITYVLLTTLVLIAASMVARKSAYAHIWVVAGFVLAAISLYMPLNGYILIAIAVTALVHPHARHLLLRKASRPTLAIGSVLFLAIISPLIIGALRDPELIRTLAGIPADWSALVANMGENLRQYTSVYAPSSGAIIVPIYGLGTLLLIALGVYRLVSTKYTTKSYILSFWLLLLLPLLCLNPSFISITFVPVVLLLAHGIDYLIWSWYRLFPRNPYARVFGLLPLGVLIGGLVVSSIDSYTYGFHYDRDVYSNYTYDIGILSNKLRTLDKSDRVLLIVDTNDKALYTSFARHQEYVAALTVSDLVTLPAKGQTTIVERELYKKIPVIPSEILVSRTAEQADRFYLYKNSSN